MRGGSGELHKRNQHILFHRVGHRRCPSILVNIDAAGCTGASAAAFHIDARNAIANGSFHHAGPVVGFDFGSGSLAVSGIRIRSSSFEFLETRKFHAIFVLAFAPSRLENANKLNRRYGVLE